MPLETGQLVYSWRRRAVKLTIPGRTNQTTLFSTESLSGINLTILPSRQTTAYCPSLRFFSNTSATACCRTAKVFCACSEGVFIFLLPAQYDQTFAGYEFLYFLFVVQKSKQVLRMNSQNTESCHIEHYNYTTNCADCEGNVFQFPLLEYYDHHVQRVQQHAVLIMPRHLVMSLSS